MRDLVYGAPVGHQRQNTVLAAADVQRAVEPTVAGGTRDVVEDPFRLSVGGRRRVPAGPDQVTDGGGTEALDRVDG